MSDAIPIINRAAGTLLVARLDQTTKDAIERANQIVTSAGGTVIGSVATGAHEGAGYGYYDAGYYGYDARDKEEERCRRPGQRTGKFRGLMPGGKDNRTSQFDSPTPSPVPVQAVDVAQQPLRSIAVKGKRSAPRLHMLPVVPHRSPARPWRRPAPADRGAVPRFPSPR